MVLLIAGHPNISGFIMLLHIFKYLLVGRGMAWHVCAHCVQPLFDPIDRSPLGSSVHGFPRQEYWSGLLFLLQGFVPTQGSDLHLLRLLHWQADSLPLIENY